MRCHPVPELGVGCWMGLIGQACNGYQLVELFTGPVIVRFAWFAGPNRCRTCWPLAYHVRRRARSTHRYATFKRGRNMWREEVRVRPVLDRVHRRTAQLVLAWGVDRATTPPCTPALSAGQIDLAKVKVLHEEVEKPHRRNRPPPVIAQVLPGRARMRPPAKLRRTMRRVVLTLDPGRGPPTPPGRPSTKAGTCGVSGTATATALPSPAVTYPPRKGRRRDGPPQPAWPTATHKAGDPNGHPPSTTRDPRAAPATSGPTSSVDLPRRRRPPPSPPIRAAPAPCTQHPRKRRHQTSPSN